MSPTSRPTSGHQTRTVRRVGGLLLGAVLFAGAAPAQTFHNLYYKGNSTNELTSVRLAINGGYIATANLPEGAALLRLQANGDLQWARHYGSPTLSLRTAKVHGGNPGGLGARRGEGDPGDGRGGSRSKR